MYFQQEADSLAAEIHVEVDSRVAVAHGEAFHVVAAEVAVAQNGGKQKRQLIFFLQIISTEPINSFKHMCKQLHKIDSYAACAEIVE